MIRRSEGPPPLTEETPPEYDFDALFREHARYVWRCLRQLGVADADAEDVCQEVFLTAQRKLSSFEGRSSLRSWLYGIALRLASDYRRSAYVRRERATAEPLEPSASEPASGALEPPEARRTLQALLSTLDEDRRAVLVLYEIEGFSMREVAEIVGCPMQTAYSRLYSARDALKAAAQSRSKETARD